MKNLKDLPDAHLKQLDKYAETVKAKFNLQCDADSVIAMEEIIEKMRNRPTSKKDTVMINALGYILGQCIITNVGGTWRIDEQLGMLVVDCNRITSYPLVKVWKQFNNGLEDSIYGFYVVTLELCKIVREGKVPFLDEPAN